MPEKSDTTFPETALGFGYFIVRLIPRNQYLHKKMGLYNGLMVSGGRIRQ